MLVKELVNTNSDPRLNFFLAPHDNFAFHRAYSMKLQANFIPPPPILFFKIGATVFFLNLYYDEKKSSVMSIRWGS
jgi:hypothetical protein